MIMLKSLLLRKLSSFSNFYIRSIFLFSSIGIFLSSCSPQLIVKSIAYESVRTTFKPTEIPDDAEIVIYYNINLSKDGKDCKIIPIVQNRTSEIMIIDQTMSFFVDTNGGSISFYDPTVRTTTDTKVSSSTSGASVNLGAIGGALGIGGVVGGLLNGINVGGSGTSGTSTSNTTYFADLPRISLAPRSNGAMKGNTISGMGKTYIGLYSGVNPNIDSESSNCKFSVCISYSLDGGNTFKKIVTDFYVNSRVVIPVKETGKVNDALRELYTLKPDALYEPCWMLYFNTNRTYYQNEDIYTPQRILYDYQ